MNKVIWQKKSLVGDECNEMDVSDKIESLGREFFEQHKDEQTPSVMDGSNKEYLVTVIVEEL